MLSTHVTSNVFRGNVDSIESAQLVVFLNKHENTSYQQEIDGTLKIIQNLSSIILLVEHPRDEERWKDQVKTICWEKPELIESIKKRKVQFEFLAKSILSFLDPNYLFKDKILAMKHIVNNARLLNLEINKVDQLLINEQLKDIEKNKEPLLLTRFLLKSWLDTIHDAYIKQTTFNTFSARQTHLIDLIKHYLDRGQQVLVVCGHSHGNPKDSTKPEEAEKLLTFIENTHRPYLIYEEHD